MDELTFTDADGLQVFYRRWLPDGPPRGGVVIVHGASEHSGRYARVAGALTDAWFAVTALDLQGHGNTAKSTGTGRMGPRGMDGVLDDITELRATTGGGGPVVIYGHSMGSIITQLYVERHGRGLAGYALSGAIGPMEGVGDTLALLQGALDAGMADEVIDMLGSFNDGFEPARTTFDWLSRDDAEVDAYIADPMCGDDNPLTYGYAAQIFGALAKGVEPANIATIPSDLPVLLLTGERDPVSNNGAQVRELESRLRAWGLPVTARYYPDARHEVLNETNRDEVTADLLQWLDGVMPRLP